MHERGRLKCESQKMCPGSRDHSDAIVGRGREPRNIGRLQKLHNTRKEFLPRLSRSVT